ncbi:MAG: M3 family metallopeptidase [Sphingomonadaceae bacterium]|uniref:M3 family metallopeptidase n=1 Tax=Thermaurantiacus sp. TaxID=2820283 RepID=UPI00298EFDCB|nr:M3 family metallopeptidase [Thermaurantiacus sp.]MCS6987342.1 M3 family metallopeptidase [Sphingomonadaceae bacterium]MDW8414563.1 M3 family metallopeptidase [Thermaurantiacus sp.]
MRRLAAAGLMALAAPLAAAPANPLLAPSPLPYGAPPWPAITVEHYRHAFEVALGQSRAAMKAIAQSRQPPNFSNTVEALELATLPLRRVAGVFFTVAAADGRPEIQTLEADIQPVLARFRAEVYLDPRLWARVRAVWDVRATLPPEQRRLVEVTYREFRRAGADLGPAERARIAAIDERLSALAVAFGQKLVADQKANEVLLTEAEMAGVPAEARAAARRAAAERGLDGFLVVPTRSEVEPFLTLATDRRAREKVWRAFDSRGDQANAQNTRPEIVEMLRLRQEKAQLLGKPSFAHHALEPAMARTPEAAMQLMMQVMTPALVRARAEEAELLALARADGLDRLEPWDWRFYAEKVRRQRFAFDEERLKSYLALPNLERALFSTVGRLWGLRFAERPDIPGYAPGVRVFEVREADGRHLGLFYADWFTRPTKRPGAWMNEIREQNGLMGLSPIVANNCNYTPGAEGRPALLSLDDAETLFHEFGHALHGLMSNTRYPSLSGTNVPRDFVELPSQLLEHWVTEPEVLATYARNAAGEPMPADLVHKVRAARTFNQGFLTVQQLASAIVDLELHLKADIGPDFDPGAFERAVLERLGVPAAVGMRHRLAHFAHLFSDPEGYAAGYYAYTWAEALEADAHRAFLEGRGPWDTDVAARFRREILRVGNAREPAESYLAFRGRMPTADALLANRGLK